MYSTIKVKWIGSFILAGILLVLAMIGGKWGTSYAANASVNSAPVVVSIHPAKVLAGSPYIIMIISGENFGSSTDTTRVRLTAPGYDEIIKPQQVIPDGISLVIEANLLLEPKVYTLVVVKSTVGTVPTIPTVPPWDETSNPVPFTVYSAFYLPLINK